MIIIVHKYDYIICGVLYSNVPLLADRHPSLNRNILHCNLRVVDLEIHKPIRCHCTRILIVLHNHPLDLVGRIISRHQIMKGNVHQLATIVARRYNTNRGAILDLEDGRAMDNASRRLPLPYKSKQRLQTLQEGSRRPCLDFRRRPDTVERATIARPTIGPRLRRCRIRVLQNHVCVGPANRSKQGQVQMKVNVRKNQGLAQIQVPRLRKRGEIRAIGIQDSIHCFGPCPPDRRALVIQKGDLNGRHFFPLCSLCPLDHRFPISTKLIH
jgi:hypothetical protein